MINRSVLSSGHPQLLSVIAHVRGRWRLKLFLRGLALSGAAALVAFIMSAFVVEKLGFAPAAVVALRIALYATVLGIAVRYLVLPLLRRVSDQQVALYLEEHEPTLDAAVLSAVELREAGPDAAGISAGLARRTIETAIERCAAVDEGRRVDQRPIRRFAAAAAAAAMLGVALVGFSPAFVRHGANALLDPLGPLSAASPYSIAVEPGDVTIPRGADQEIRALLGGFTSENIEVVVRRGADAAFERIPMAAGDSAGFELLLFDIDQPTEYFVEAGGVRSSVHHIEVADLPYVQTLQLVYHFPAYTGLEPRVIEEGGDIAVLRGTTVEVRATPTIPTPAGGIVVGDSTIALEADADGVLDGSMRVDEEGFYHLEMTAPDGSSITASPVYSIDVLDDMPPAVSFSKPGRDARVTSIEEMFVEAKAEDDYGVAEIDLVYSVNGGEEQTKPLYRSDDPLTEVSAGHTFYLEELELEPGDLVAYHARVKDNNATGSGQSTKSDIYFLTVRPFGMDYRQAQQPPGGGGGGGGLDNGRLSEIQREIISATFNVSRDGAEDTDDFAEKLNTIVLSQEKLREQVETLAQRMNNRGITRDSSFQQIAGLLPEAAQHMDSATNNLREREPTDALPPEQKALQILLRAEAIFRDVQVALGGEGGGGGGGSPNAEDLADLFELELDKLRNQYETVQRGERERTENQVDETLERLRELARRQEQEAERMRRQAQAGQGGSSNSAQSQRELAEETEQAARELERLSRETQQPQLMEAARRLQEAADAMRRSAANTRSGNSADAARALDRIEEARRRLGRNRSSQLEQETQQALERAEELVREQREIEAGMNSLNEQTGAGRSAQARRLVERKEQEHAAVDNLERQLDRMANDARGDQPDASRELQEAASSVRDNQIKEKIRYSRALTEPRADPNYAREMEADITKSLEQLRDRIGDAREAVGRQDEADRTANSLEQTRDLVRGMESLSQRTRAAQQEAERRRLGERPGQQGGQDPQQGQPGEQGGEGQQQGGEGQQQSGEGQQQGGEGQQQGGEGQQRGGEGGQGGQGQEGERGQAAGQPGGEPSGGERTAGGSYNPGGTGDARGAIAPGDVRQFRREVRERLAEAERLRDQLARDGQDVSQLDDAIRNMRELDDDRIYGVPLDLDRLQSSVVDGLKQFEYALRRQLQGDVADNPFLSNSDEVPEGYRTLVEEYYRALSRRNER